MTNVLAENFLELKNRYKFFDIFFYGSIVDIWRFSDSSVAKKPAFNAGDPHSIPGSGRSGERKSYPLQYSWASLVA